MAHSTTAAMNAGVDRRQALGWSATLATALLLPRPIRGQMVCLPTVLLLDPALTSRLPEGLPVIRFDLVDLSWVEMLAAETTRSGAQVQGITSWSGMVVANALLAPHGLRPSTTPVRRGSAIVWHADRERERAFR